MRWPLSRLFAPPPADRFAPARAAFARRFPGGTFESLDFRPHFDGHAHSAWAAVEPQASAADTLAVARGALADTVAALRPVRSCFGPHDRVQFAVGFAEAVKPTRRRVLRGWVPAARLADARPPDFAAVGGALCESAGWSDGLWA